jgi:hypothetical protein
MLRVEHRGSSCYSNRNHWEHFSGEATESRAQWTHDGDDFVCSTVIPTTVLTDPR